MLIQGQVGPSSTQSVQPGSTPAVRLGQQGDLIASELHGRFYEQTYRGASFRTGTTATVTATSNHGTTNGLNTTLATAAAATPMLGIWNPPTSSVNVVLTQATLATFISTATSPNPFSSLVWAVSLGNNVITTGLTPWNSKTLLQSGSQVKGFAGSTALTGLTNIFTAIENADFSSGGSVQYGTVATTALMPSYISTQNFDGQLIVPPGAVLALYNTSQTTTMNFTGRLLWEEVPL